MIEALFSYFNYKLKESSFEDPSNQKNSAKEEKKITKKPNKNDHISNFMQQKSIYNSESYGKIIYAEHYLDSGNKIYLFTVKLTDDSEHTACLENIQWNVMIGDKVKVLLAKKLAENESEIIEILPKKTLHEVNRVTAIEDKYAVFDNSKILFYNTAKDIGCSLKMCDEYKNVAIESDQKSGTATYSYRVISLFEKVETSNIGRGITFHNNPFKIYLNQVDAKKDSCMKHIKILNKSDKTVTLQSMKIIPLSSENASLIRFGKADAKINFKMKPKIGAFKAFFNIHPIKTGKFFFNLIVAFSDFNEKYEFCIEIFNGCIIPGERSFKTPRFVEVHLSEYSVPNDLREIDLNKFHNAIEEIEDMYPCLKEKLSPKNYFEVMKLGIYFEELCLEQAFASYHIERETFETKGEYLKLTVNEVAERRPSIICGDKVIATEISKSESSKTLNYEGYISKVGNDSVYCKFDSRFHDSHEKQDGAEYSIDFIFNRAIFRRQQHALESIISNGVLGYNFLFPNDKICMKEIQLDASIDAEENLLINNKQHPWFYSHLNKYQKTAVVNVLRGEKRPLPYIFFGCPGSGKTQTVMETVLQIHKHDKSSKIIIATPSNSAANLIVEMIINSDALQKDAPDFLRIVGNNQIERDLIPENIIKYCATVSIASDSCGNNVASGMRNKRGFLENCTKSAIKKYRIIIATLNGLGFFLQMSFDSYFTHVVIDEAGQSVEPELLIPITMLKKSGQCVLSGDPKQLGPIVLSRFGQHYDINVSMLERLLKTHEYYSQKHGTDKNEYDQKFVTKLIINYRSHPTVLKVYNEMFYNNEMKGAINDTDSREATLLNGIEDLIWNDTSNKCGVFFVDVCNGKNKKVLESCSWYNDQEINAVMAFLNKCQEKNIPFKDIGVMTPYSLQLKKLKNKIAAMKNSDLKIGTVEEFQGQEKLIMIVSTVRTERRHLSSDSHFNLGFLRCPKRINVAISRARALMVIFGKESVLEKDAYWESLIKYTKANKTYVTECY